MYGADQLPLGGVPLAQTCFRTRIATADKTEVHRTYFIGLLNRPFEPINSLFTSHFVNARNIFRRNQVVFIDQLNGLRAENHELTGSLTYLCYL